jgi:hypothetical protein
MTMKDQLFENLIIQVESQFRDESPLIVPNEEKKAMLKGQCEAFTRLFPDDVPGHYRPREPEGADLAERTRFWLKNFTILVSNCLIHDRLRENIAARPELDELTRFVAESKTALRQARDMCATSATSGNN